LKEQTNGDWVKCLKLRTKKNPEEIKTQIHETIKQVIDLELELVSLEKVINLDECSKWQHFISAEIVEKYYGDCKANESLIKNSWTKLTTFVTNAKKQFDEQSPNFLLAKSEQVRLSELDESKPMPKPFYLSIGKDKWVGDGLRKPCIVMDEDNTDVNECYFENVKDPGEIYPQQQQKFKEIAKILVWVDKIMYWCDKPSDVDAADSTETVEAGEFDAKK